MEGLIVAAQEAIVATVNAALANPQGAAQEECERLARYTLKLGLLLGELQLCLRSNEPLRGSKTVFLAVDATANALRQAEQLVVQCAGTRPSSIWPLEDAVEFAAVAAELRSAAAGLAALGGRLPADVQQDAAHVYQQFMSLGFTEDELSETEEQELERVQQHHSTATSPRHPAATAADDAAAPVGLAPPAAPAEQFDRPEEALANPALVVGSQAVAAAARAASLPVAPPSEAEVQQREALQGAAAVATIAAAEVLSGGEEEEEAALLAPTHQPGGQPGQGAVPAATGQEEAGEGQGQQVLREEVAEEAAEAAAAAVGALGVVVTPEGQVAMSPTAVSKGAVPARGASPLPPDPFDMSGADDSNLRINTLRELKSFQHDQEGLAIADEAQRQLDAPPDCLSLQEQQQQAAEGGAAGGGAVGTEALAALQQLQDFESAMGAGEEAEEAAQAEEGREPKQAVASSVAAQPGAAGLEAAEPRLAGAAAEVQPLLMHKSRSQAASAEMERNLAELSLSELATPVEH